MDKKTADLFLNEQLKKYIDKARNAKNDEELILFTDEAHKLYITLNTYDGFEDGKPVIESSIPQ